MKKELSFLKENLIAHRGMHSEKIPENSLKAFEQATQNNFIIELDIHVLKDGNVVVFHDDNLKRMTGIDKEIKDTTYDEIKNLKLKKTNYYIPLLKDVLKLVNGRVPIIIEFKSDTKIGLLESKAWEILKNYRGSYCVKSFDPRCVYWFKKHHPEVIRGQLLTLSINTLRKYSFFLNLITKPDFISCDIRDLPNKKIAKLKKKKIILGWTVRTPKDYLKCMKYCDNAICEHLDKNDYKILKLN